MASMKSTLYPFSLFSFTLIIASPSFTVIITFIFPTHRPTVSLPLLRVPHSISRATTPQDGNATTSCGWTVSSILRRHTKPARPHDRDGGQPAHSRDPGFSTATVFVGIYRQASRYAISLVAFTFVVTVHVRVRRRWRNLPHIFYFTNGIPQRWNEISRERTAVRHSCRQRSSALPFHPEIHVQY